MSTIPTTEEVQRLRAEAAEAEAKAERARAEFYRRAALRLAWELKSFREHAATWRERSRN